MGKKNKIKDKVEVIAELMDLASDQRKVIEELGKVLVDWAPAPSVEPMDESDWETELAEWREDLLQEGFSARIAAQKCTYIRDFLVGRGWITLSEEE